jgi:hypothetical protein
MAEKDAVIAELHAALADVSDELADTLGGQHPWGYPSIWERQLFDCGLWVWGGRETEDVADEAQSILEGIFETLASSPTGQWILWALKGQGVNFVYSTGSGIVEGEAHWMRSDVRGKSITIYPDVLRASVRDNIWALTHEIGHLIDGCTHHPWCELNASTLQEPIVMGLTEDAVLSDGYMMQTVSEVIRFEVMAERAEERGEGDPCGSNNAP